MATLIDRIDDTRTHLSRESLALVTRTRRAFVSEANDWQSYIVSQRDAVRAEVTRLSSPRGIERAALKLADEALARAHETVHARLSRIERELSRASMAAKAGAKAKKARPAAKRARGTSRRLVTEPSQAS